MAQFPDLLKRYEDAACTAAAYRRRYDSYGIGSYLLISRQLHGAAHQWLARAQRQSQRTRSRLPLV